MGLQNIGRVNYSLNTTPEGYVCDGCGKQGVRLWRSTVSVPKGIYCKDCASGRSQGKGVDSFSFEIGYFVRAIPAEQGQSFLGIGSISPKAFDWWKSLPM